MPKTPRGKWVPDASGESFVVVNKAPNGEAEPFFDRTRQVWVAPWRKPDSKVGRPTGKTRALAVASRDRHVAKAAHEAQFGELADGFTAHTTVGELSAWWLEHVARHRVRPTSLATYRKHASVIDEGSVQVRRGSTYADRVGMVLGPTKTRGATGVQMLGRTVVSLLRARHDLHEADRAVYPGPWPTVEYDGEQLDLVFTTADGTPTLRQHVDRAIRKAAERADIDSAGLGTHASRRSVVTTCSHPAHSTWKTSPASSATTTSRPLAAMSSTKATDRDRSANAPSNCWTRNRPTRRPDRSPP
jgi:hypothetical protein